MTTDTVIYYETLYQPHFGEHVAWGDTGTVIYANSVFGARTNFEKRSRRDGRCFDGTHARERLSSRRASPGNIHRSRRGRAD